MHSREHSEKYRALNALYCIALDVNNNNTITNVWCTNYVMFMDVDHLGIFEQTKRRNISQHTEPISFTDKQFFLSQIRVELEMHCSHE